MYLLKALNDFSTKSMTRLALPQVEALSKACVGFENAAKRPEDAEDRIRRILNSFRAGKAASQDRRDIRFVTAAIGSSELIGLAEASGILSEVERRNDHRLFRTVFKALLASYRESDFRRLIRPFSARHLNALQPNTRFFCKASGILEGYSHLQKLGGELARSMDTNSFCVSKGISSNILASNYGTGLKLAAVREAVKLPDENALKTFLAWSFAGINGTPVADYYEAMLSPFESHPPLPSVQKILISKIVEKFGDPRLHLWPGLKGNDGQARRETCVATIKRWLSIEYLDLFITIIESTAVDRQFRPRKAFWLKYFEKDVISDVTLILAADANNAARRIRSQMDNTEYMQWGNLIGALTDQSVLLMRLGDLVIAEWSHSGAMRFWKADDKSAPKFHSKDYVGAALRRGSLKIRVGNEFRESLVHQHNGSWMRWASNAIKYHTGVSA
jgi:EH_Signature domain